MDIKLIKLYQGPCYLPQDVVKDRTLSPTSEPQDIKRWWTNATEEFKKLVFEKRTKDENIEAVGVIIEQLSDVTIYAHQYGNKKYTSPQIVPNEDIREIVDLKETTDEPKLGDRVLVHWVDASHNNTPISFEEAANDWEGIIDITQWGFLIHRNDERVMLGGSWNKNVGKFKYITAIPRENVRSMVRLEKK